MLHSTTAQRLVDFINTKDLRRPDRREPPFAPDEALGDSAALDRWLVANGLGRDAPADHDDLDLARRLRAGLRGLLRRDGFVSTDAAGINAVAAELPLVVRVDPSGHVLTEPVADGPRGALTELLADLLLLRDGGELDRLKACASDDCRWAFVDHSRPGIGRWCSSTDCGNRDKTRRYRGRRRAAAARISPPRAPG